MKEQLSRVTGQLLLVYNMFPTIDFFGHTIGTYTICAAIGILLCAVVGYLLIRKKDGVCIDDLIVTAVFIVVGMVLGGHVIFAITNTTKIIALFQNMGKYSFIDFVQILFGSYLGGMVFYGGVLGGLLALHLVCKHSQFGHPDVMYDMYAVCIPLFHVFGRIGCFLGGCCYGVECKLGFTVHGNTLNPGINDVNRFPVQLVEAACNLIIFIVLLTLHRKKKFEHRLLVVYFFIYPVVRFILEFFRGDEIRGFLFGLSTSQIISIILLISALVITCIDLRKAKLQK